MLVKPAVFLFALLTLINAIPLNTTASHASNHTAPRSISNITTPFRFLNNTVPRAIFNGTRSGRPANATTNWGARSVKSWNPIEPGSPVGERTPRAVAPKKRTNLRRELLDSAESDRENFSPHIRERRTTGGNVLTSKRDRRSLNDDSQYNGRRSGLLPAAGSRQRRCQSAQFC